MEGFIIRYGLLAVFVGAAVEGDVCMILTGVLAHMGLLDFRLAVAVGTCGALAADGVLFGIGRARAAAVRNSRTYTRVGAVIERLAKRLGAREIVVARFVYGTRSASMLFWGMEGLPFRHFAVLDLIGCALWATALAGLGFAFSGSAAMLIGKVKRAERWLLVGLIMAALAVAAVRITMRWRLGATPATHDDVGR